MGAVYASNPKTLKIWFDFRWKKSHHPEQSQTSWPPSVPSLRIWSMKFMFSFLGAEAHEVQLSPLSGNLSDLISSGSKLLQSCIYIKRLCQANAEPGPLYLQVLIFVCPLDNTLSIWSGELLEARFWGRELLGTLPNPSSESICLLLLGPHQHAWYQWTCSLIQGCKISPLSF